MKMIFDIETDDANAMYYHKPKDFFRIGAWTGLSPDSKTWLTDDYYEMCTAVSTAELVIGHNIIAFDLPALHRQHFDLLAMTRARRVLDTWTMASVLDQPIKYTNRNNVTMFPDSPARLKSYYALDNLAFQYGVEGKTNDLKALAKQHGGFGSIPTDDETYRDYLRGDVAASRAVLGHLLQLGGGISDYVWREQRVAAIASTISKNGFRLDQELAQQRVGENDEIQERNVRWLVTEHGLPIYKADGKTLAADPTATKEGKAAIHRILLDFGIPDEDIPRTKTGIALGKDPLMELAARHPKIAVVAETIAQLKGLRSVYQTALDNVHADGYCHPDIFTLQASGRWSVQGPGLTVFGKRGGRHVEREIFLPDEADEQHVLFSVDLSQVDARAVAAHCQDPNYLALFEPGRDLHMENAVNVWGQAAVTANPKLRELAKVLGHGTNYRMGFNKLAAIPGVGEKTAREFLDAMERNYPGLIRWQGLVTNIGEHTGVLDNGFGRSMKVNRERAYTQSSALVGQGCARDIAMTGALKMDDDVIRMCKVHVHDEFVFSAPISQAKDVRQHVMESLRGEYAPPGASRAVAIEADGSKFGLNWGQVYV